MSANELYDIRQTCSSCGRVFHVALQEKIGKKEAPSNITLRDIFSIRKMLRILVLLLVMILRCIFFLAKWLVVIPIAFGYCWKTIIHHTDVQNDPTHIGKVKHEYFSSFRKYHFEMGGGTSIGFSVDAIHLGVGIFCTTWLVMFLYGGIPILRYFYNRYSKHWMRSRYVVICVDS